MERDPTAHSISLCFRMWQENKDASVVYSNQNKDGLWVVAGSHQVEDGVWHSVGLVCFLLYPPLLCWFSHPHFICFSSRNSLCVIPDVLYGDQDKSKQ